MEHATISPQDLLIKSPFRMLVVGPTSSGKTTIVHRLLKHPKVLFGTNFDHIVYAVPKMTDTHHEFVNLLQQTVPNVTIHQGIPNVEELSVMGGRKLLILDDLIQQVVNDNSMHSAFTMLSSHTNTNIILISQNYFTQGKFANSLIRNISDKILFNDRSDKMWLNTVSRRMFPASTGFLNNAMSWVVENFSEPYEHYLYIDTNPRSKLSAKFQVRTNIVPSDDKDEQKKIKEPIFLTPT